MTSNLSEIELKTFLRPEMRNRIDEIIKFKDLSKDVVKKIVNTNVNEMVDDLKQKGLHCIVSPNVLKYLVNNGYQPEYGARPIKRLIRRDILSEITKHMLKHQNLNKIKIDYTDKIIIENIESDRFKEAS